MLLFPLKLPKLVVKMKLLLVLVIAALCVALEFNCPISGSEVDENAFIEFKNGQKVFFCCKGCAKGFLKNPTDYLVTKEQEVESEVSI